MGFSALRGGEDPTAPVWAASATPHPPTSGRPSGGRRMSVNAALMSGGLSSSGNGRAQYGANGPSSTYVQQGLPPSRGNERGSQSGVPYGNGNADVPTARVPLSRPLTRQSIASLSAEQQQYLQRYAQQHQQTSEASSGQRTPSDTLSHSANATGESLSGLQRLRTGGRRGSAVAMQHVEAVRESESVYEISPGTSTGMDRSGTLRRSYAYHEDQRSSGQSDDLDLNGSFTSPKLTSQQSRSSIRPPKSARGGRRGSGADKGDNGLGMAIQGQTMALSTDTSTPKRPVSSLSRRGEREKERPNPPAQSSSSHRQSSTDSGNGTGSDQNLNQDVQATPPRDARGGRGRLSVKDVSDPISDVDEGHGDGDFLLGDMTGSIGHGLRKVGDETKKMKEEVLGSIGEITDVVQKHIRSITASQAALHAKGLSPIARGLGSRQGSLVKLLQPRRQDSTQLLWSVDMPEANAPTGTVTLVFTDIQDSTLLWETNSAAMKRLLELHNTVFRRLIRVFNGYEVKTEGDAFMIAFQDTADAVEWCMRAQIDLMDAAWPEELSNLPQLRAERLPGAMSQSKADLVFHGPRVRMGVHVGQPSCEIDPVTRRMDYYGPTVNKAARIADLAEGGQIVLSKECTVCLEPHMERLKDLKPKITPLGKFKLKGIEGLETIVQIMPSRLAGRMFAAHTKKAVKRSASSPLFTTAQLSIAQFSTNL